MTESRVPQKRSPEGSRPRTGPNVAPSVVAHPLLELQQTAGNRLTVDLVARQMAPLTEVGGAAHDQATERIQRAGAGTQALIKQFTSAPAAIPAATSTPAAADDTQLKAVAKQEAEALIQSAKPVEGKVTALLKALASANEGKLEGLQNRLKMVPSLQEKLVKGARTRVTSGEPLEVAVKAEAATIKDALRYTIVVPPKAYATFAATTVRDELAKIGATRIKGGNYWAEPLDDGYTAVNSAYEIDSPEGKVRFEVQIHTAQSWATKSGLHAQYEDARKEKGKMPEHGKAWLNNYQKTRWKSVEMPPGMAEYDKNFRKKP